MSTAVTAVAVRIQRSDRVVRARQTDIGNFRPAWTGDENCHHELELEGRATGLNLYAGSDRDGVTDS